MEDEGFRVVNSFRSAIWRGKEAPANHVPEASVIRGVQALSGFTGRKGFRRRIVKSGLKARGSTAEMDWILAILRTSGETGILGGGVKSVDIERNVNGEGRSLGCS